MTWCRGAIATVNPLGVTSLEFSCETKYDARAWSSPYGGSFSLRYDNNGYLSVKKYRTGFRLFTEYSKVSTNQSIALLEKTCIANVLHASLSCNSKAESPIYRILRIMCQTGFFIENKWCNIVLLVYCIFRFRIPIRNRI